MSRIRGKNTAPEKVVRSILHRMGYRFRLHGKKLPGRPDIVLTRYKTVVFVHGCFWHRHRGCANCTTPTHRRAWWLTKLQGNAKGTDRTGGRCASLAGELSSFGSVKRSSPAHSRGWDKRLQRF